MTTASAISVPYISVEEYLHSTYESDMELRGPCVGGS